MKKLVSLIITVTLVLISNLSFATTEKEFTQAVVAFCESQKHCLLEQINQQALSEEMKPMVTAMVNGMCASMVEQYQSTIAGQQRLYKPALACIDSMKSLGCKQLMDNPTATPQCKELEHLAEKTHSK